MKTVAPRSLPALQTMLDDLGGRNVEQLAKHLGVSTRTVKRWRARGGAPRAVMLALFWETTWGRSVVNCQAENAARAFAGYARCLSEANGLRMPPMHREAANAGAWAPSRPRLVV
jgi:uncharacterized protein YjcR